MTKLDKIFLDSEKMKINTNSKIVIMSDCHRGDGNTNDNFIKNRNIYKAALLYYYDRGFTYIELGDGDEMLEVKNYQEIIEEYIDIFKILKKYHDRNRLIMIYGNHDKCKKSNEILTKYFYTYYNKTKKKTEDLLNNLKIRESIILDYNGYEIFLVHGHQGDLLSDDLWKLSRFLVRYVWKPLESIGIKDPTSAAKNNKVKNKTEKRLKNWSKENNKIIIAGHTHRPIFPKVGESMYFNDGSCIHPNGITCLEIENGQITLVRWILDVRENESIYVKREIIEGTEPIKDFFKKK